MNEILEEVRAAYASVGIEIEGVATYGTYYRLRCARCGAGLGCIGDRLLSGMARELVEGDVELYAAGLAGCRCGYQAERAAEIDPARAAAAKARLG